MSIYKGNLFWVLLHLAAILVVFINLLTGLRIASVSRPEWQAISAVLPQGLLHPLHFTSGILLIVLIVGYISWRILTQKQRPKPFTNKTLDFHRLVIRLGYLLFFSIILSGLLSYFSLAPALMVAVHYYCALAVIGYLLLHGGGYFVHYGLTALKRILWPSWQLSPVSLGLLVVTFLLAAVGLQVTDKASHALPVAKVPLSQLIHIDGKADEAVWQQAETLDLLTQGGANFDNGQTRIRVQVVENGIEAFFHISWDDPTKSLKHLPLLKTETGWQVEQQGFHNFDETRYYEDKLAVMVSNQCQAGGAGTVHLGPKPLKDKPANWHGKGYHYSQDGAIRDLWHWKAVRTNNMILADDNFIGPPDKVRPGSRRYSAGYLQDGKESGAYVMNWAWYKPDLIIPKRLPKSSELLTPYQQENTDSLSWVIPWFDYQPYQAEQDDYPVGTRMPSVMYRSNRFEGDRADVRAFARWHQGRWSLELSRKLDTGSQYDVALKNGVCLWVSAFDQSQVAHTRHALPIVLEFSGA